MNEYHAQLVKVQSMLTTLARRWIIGEAQHTNTKEELHQALGDLAESRALLRTRDAQSQRMRALYNAFSAGFSSVKSC